MTVRTQVAIIGAGPAGLMLSHLLHLSGIESVVLESRSREYVEGRTRAGVLEQGAADLLRQAGVGERMDREGLVHNGIHLQFEGHRHHVDFLDLTGRGIMVHGQREVVCELIKARLAAGGEILFEHEAVAVHDLEGRRPRVTHRHGGDELTLECDYVAACDGAHGIGRRSMPAGSLRVYHHEFPYGWLGVLALTPPLVPELIYACHERGFALHSMRSPEISRLYLQVDLGEDLASWPAARIWPELRLRLGEEDLREGEIVDIGITPMRSVVLEPMQHGRLFLAGDAAHTVPPTGAKGMNLALADVRTLARALGTWYGSGSTAELEGYTQACLRRVWRAQHFSAFMTNLLLRDPAGDPFMRRVQLAHLAYIAGSRAAATSLAEGYTGP
ncbi:MAG TPA: 4-hydroxybenzoate 3-monooxygenase, partial [Patescibacteria group bacterium]|nr:4-hydroxybenzoate 3-monooxygenase [Patescibacteria group bacterium]